MWPDPQKTADLVTFTEEILNGKLHFLCSASYAPKIIFSELRVFLHGNKYRKNLPLQGNHEDPKLVSSQNLSKDNKILY